MSLWVVLVLVALTAVLFFLVGWVVRANWLAPDEAGERSQAEEGSARVALDRELRHRTSELAQLEARLAELEMELAACRQARAALQMAQVPAERPATVRATGGVDDLQRVKGIGNVLEVRLRELGITSFRQIARFSSEDRDRVREVLKSFKNRIERDDWIGQARQLYREQYGEEP